MEIYTVAGLILLAVIIIGAGVFYFQSRQANALRSMLKVEEQRLAHLIKSRRDQLAKDVKVDNCLGWLAELLSAEVGRDIDLDQVAVSLKAPFALDLLASGGKHVVVSPMNARQLKKALGRVVKRETGAGFSEHQAVLASIRGAKAYRFALVDSQTSLIFDLEAQAVGRGLGIDWGQPEELWFMLA